ncbi:hypothetical protein AMS68_004820 [Peltaster fructicola]|uniref:NADH:ubiquinone oxidoreductase intermediate-associated protein 30 domain-containing protein n=1 Tax=Peltaster fructicola TaxID=286661 RepID=A0A6H0XX30_9PEZI|nr:hypothetical protein AMS68_004820 [Peltaster fructicola]
MRATLAMAGMPSFWRRTVDHVKRQTNMAVTLGGLTVPTKPYPLVQFNSPNIIDHCKAMSDRGIGGFSVANLTYQAGNTPALDMSRSAASLILQTADPKPDEEPPHALFSGTVSTELPRNDPSIQRTGFTGWRTRDMGFSAFGKVFWDLGQYTYLVMRVKSDGRKYFVNIQTDTIVPTDIHQHILPTRTPGQWETIAIPFSDFVRTNHGLVVEPQNEMQTMKVRSLGIGLTDRIQGPFELRIAEAYASNSSSKNVSKDSGFDLREQEEEEEPLGLMDTPQPKRKPGEPEQILM